MTVDRNQIANFTYLDYTTNIDISDAPPVEYVTVTVKNSEKKDINELVHKTLCQKTLRN